MNNAADTLKALFEATQDLAAAALWTSSDVDPDAILYAY